jgi:hypothetical protein
MSRRVGTFFSGALLIAVAMIARPAINQAQVAERASAAPAIGQRAVGFAVSQPARDLPPDVATAVGPDQGNQRVRIIPNREIPRPGMPVDEDLVVQQMMPVPNVMPGLGVSFNGLSNLDNLAAIGFQVVPPDTVGDVGPAHYVQQTNMLVRVFNKAGAALTAPFRLSSLFAPLGGLCSTGDNGDPIVLYDPLADRWLLSQFRFTALNAPPYHECIAVSRTSDPAGAYFLYDFVTPGNNFPDYPHFGVWPDAYYMTTNQFFLGGSFNGAGAFAFERAKMLVGDATASLIYINLDFASHPEGIGGMLPADLDGVSAPPAGAPNVFAYFTANEFGDPADAIRLFNFHADFAVPANSTFIERPGSPLLVAAFNPLTPAGGDIPQPPPASSSANLDAIADRLMNRLQYRNRGGFESLVVNHTVDANATSAFTAGVRYYELRNGAPGGVYAVNEQATFSPDSTHRWMGSAAVDHQGNLAVGFSASSTSLFPSIRYAGRVTTDPPNGLFQGEATLIAGAGSQTTTFQRWGDYSALVVDPADDCTFWYTTEYYGASSSLSWQTRVGSFKFASCPARSTGTLNVNVTTCSSGSPVANALVKLNAILWGATAANGTFSAKLDPGIYNINAEKSGVGTGLGSATVNAGGTATANVCLGAGGGGTVDLSVTSLKAKAKAAVGASVSVKYTIANSGTSASDPTTTQVFLSTNPTWDAGDTLVGSTATAAIPSGGSINQLVAASIPPGTPPSVRYLIVFADGPNVESETNESNNTRAKKISLGPNLVISSLSILPASVAAGGTITINETTKNTGAQATGGSSTTTWYLSVDKNVGPGDTVLGTHAVPALAPNATNAKSQVVTIPAGRPPGTYWIIADADSGGVISEFSEANKKLVKLTIF